MRRRIYGIETEFGITAVNEQGRALTSEDAARALFAGITAAHHASSVFLTNGSRLYLDVGSHPEFATAECDDIYQLLVHDRAGEDIVRGLAEQASATVSAERGEAVRVVLLKNNTDSHGNSYGTHENYLLARQEDFTAFTDALLPFLVTRQLVCGAGKVMVADGKPGYVLSQRADHMRGEAVSSSTTRTRPMINTRDEPHANPQKFRRMHVIVGDANMAEASALMKIASTELVLRALEEGDPAVFARWTLDDPVTAIRSASLRRDGAGTIQLASGSSATALDIQRFYCEHVAEYVDSPLLRQAYALWRQTLEALEARRWEKLASTVDWAAKLRWLEAMADRYGVGLLDPRIQRLDLAYHDIASVGLARMLESKGQLARLTDPSHVAEAQHRAPETTRARLRGMVVQAGETAGRQVQVDWTKMEATGLSGATVLCHDPFAAHDARIDALVERILHEPLQQTGFNFADGRPI